MQRVELVEVVKIHSGRGSKVSIVEIPAVIDHPLRDHPAATAGRCNESDPSIRDRDYRRLPQQLRHGVLAPTPRIIHMD